MVLVKRLHFRARHPPGLNPDLLFVNLSGLGKLT